MKPSFPAKILLFGEYSILAGSDACAFPLNQFSGRLGFPEPTRVNSKDAIDSNYGLQKFLNYLREPQQHDEAARILDFERLAADVSAGLIFQSDIPRNYGTGSSGALTASIYSSYQKNRLTNPDAIRSELAFIESAFHSKSSGIDPLVSYLGKAVFIRKGKVSTSDISLEDLRKNLHIELIDSGIPGKTKFGVTNFLSDYLNDAVKNELFSNRYIPLVNEITQSIEQGNFDQLFEKILHISECQLQLFPNLFTPEIATEARSGLDSGRYAIKLCGSGGGGFYLKISL